MVSTISSSFCNHGETHEDCAARVANELSTKASPLMLAVSFLSHQPGFLA
jgi:NADPH-dependent 7-cyano-7-deazaguanine reductase QueF